MKAIAAVLVLLILTPAPLAAQDYFVGETRFLEWDYPAGDLPSITRFEIQVNGGNWVKVGLVFRWQIPAFVAGAYIARLRACKQTSSTTSTCSSSIALAFNILPLTTEPPPAGLVAPLALRLTPLT